jgi:hypothetical protein
LRGRRSASLKRRSPRPARTRFHRRVTTHRVPDRL